MVLSGRTGTGLLTAVLLTQVLAVGPAAAQGRGTLRGRVELHHVVSPSKAGADHGMPGDIVPSHAAPQPYRQAVVYFESAPEPPEPAAVTRVQMHQRDQTFVPHLLAITVGTTVDFPNDDTTYHNVFSLSKAKRFDLGRYAVGKSKAVKLDTPGIVRVFCDIHSQMNAFILVFPHRFFAVTDDEGRFHIDRIPAGTYKVTAWYEGVSRQTQEVTITPGATTEAVFEVK